MNRILYFPAWSDYLKSPSRKLSFIADPVTLNKIYTKKHVTTMLWCDVIVTSYWQRHNVAIYNVLQYLNEDFLRHVHLSHFETTSLWRHFNTIPRVWGNAIYESRWSGRKR